MTFLFREIENKSWWDKSQDDLTWLEEGQLVADVFKGLRTEKGTLSTYFIDAERSNESRVVAAFACTRESLQRVDYVLIPTDAVADIFKTKIIPGETADDEVNRWHRDIVDLTAQKLVELARLIDNHQDLMVRVPWKTVEKTVRNARNRRNIDCERVHPRLRPKICD